MIVQKADGQLTGDLLAIRVSLSEPSSVTTAESTQEGPISSTRVLYTKETVVSHPH